MSSDPNERSRRSGRGKWPVLEAAASLTAVILLLAPVPAIAQGMSAANEPEAVPFPNFLFIGGVAVVFLAVMALNSFFVTGEAAVNLLRPIHAKGFDEGSRSNKILTSAFERKEAIVASCVLGAQTMRAWLVLLSMLPAPWLARAVGWTAEGAAGTQTYMVWLLTGALAAIPVMGLNVVFAELVGKSYAVAHPAQATLKLYPLLQVFTWLLKLPGQVAMSIAGLVTHRFGTAARFTTDNHAEEEIKEILVATEESGGIEEEEREMLHSVFEFGDTVAREVMTPRVDVDSIRVDTPLGEIAELVEESGHSRFPVYEVSDDEIIGVVHAKDVLGALARGDKSVPLRRLIRPAHHVPETKNLHELLAEMKLAKTQMSIVNDEFGGTAGIVTIEDIVEELVGEIVDEYDDEIPEVVEVESGHSVSGKLHLDDVNDAIGTAFDSEEFDTIGGYVFGLFGRQPKTGESISDELYLFQIEESDGRRILRIRIEPHSEEELVPEESRA